MREELRWKMTGFQGMDWRRVLQHEDPFDGGKLEVHFERKAAHVEDSYGFRPSTPDVLVFRGYRNPFLWGNPHVGISDERRRQ